MSDGHPSFRHELQEHVISVSSMGRGVRIAFAAGLVSVVIPMLLVAATIAGAATNTTVVPTGLICCLPSCLRMSRQGCIQIKFGAGQVTAKPEQLLGDAGKHGYCCCCCACSCQPP